jgi:HK97 family phage major capsid protein
MSDTIEFPALTELQGKIDDRSEKLGKIFDEAGPAIDLTKVKCISGDSSAKAEQIRKLNDELSDLGSQRDQMAQVYKAAERTRSAGAAPEANGGENGSEPDGGKQYRQAIKEHKRFGELFIGSKAYKGRAGREAGKLDVELKALFETGAGWAPETTRTGRVVEEAVRPVQVTDLVPMTTTGQAAVVYMEETTFTNAAVETAEGDASAEATLALTEQSSTVRKIAVHIPVTDEQLEDEPQVRGYLDNRLPFMLRQRLDSQILNGDGVAPNLRGILNTVGIQSQAKGTDPIPDAIYKAIVLGRVTGRAMPNGVVFNPFDWQKVRLLRTSDGLYIWGNPSEAGPERIWGLNVAQGDVLTAGTALVGDFANFSELASRRGVDVQVSNSHGSNFIEGKQTVRADVRVAMVVYRPAAFVQVTGV